MKDSRAVNVKGNQEGGGKYASNVDDEMIKEIIANLRNKAAISFSEWIAEWELADWV